LSAAWVVGSRARRQAGPGARVAARQQAEVGAAAGRGRPRLPGEAGGGRAPARGRPCAAAGPRRTGGRARRPGEAGERR